MYANIEKHFLFTNCGCEMYNCIAFRTVWNECTVLYILFLGIPVIQ
jgi:hypothetical protein